MPPVTSNTSRSAPPANTGSAAAGFHQQHLDVPGARLQPVRSVHPAGVRPAAPRRRGARRHGAHQRGSAGTKASRSPKSGRSRTKRRTCSRSSTASPTQMQLLWKPGGYERGGNTKTHGMVRGEFTVHDGLPAHLRRGVFAEPKTYRAWVRFCGPGTVRDARHRRRRVHEHQHQAPGRAGAEADGGGAAHAGLHRRLHAHLRHAGHQGQRAPAEVEREERADLPLPEPDAAAPAGSHHAGPVDQDAEQPVRSALLQLRAVPAGRGPGHAVLGLADVHDADADSAPAAASARRLPARRDGGGAGQRRRARSTSACRCRPIRIACRSRTTACSGRSGCRRRVSVATLRLPRQRFDSPAQIAFARRLSYNPWHCVPEHRPLGNQSRARRRMYYELSQLRHRMNDVPHYEPTGDEVFE